MTRCSEMQGILGRPPPWIVGVLNVTPDSFSDGGRYLGSNAVAAADRLIGDGADILEVGAEATGPGSLPVSTEKELERLEPVLNYLQGRALFGVDSYKSEVAERAANAGALYINDTSALRADSRMAQVVASRGLNLILMYAKDGPLPHVTEIEPVYTDPVSQIAQFLNERRTAALEAGVSESRIILDSGMGRFVSADPEVSWRILREYRRLCTKCGDAPFMIGVSRKGFLGGRLEDRDAVSQLAALRAAENGAMFIRTHNPAMMRDFLKARSKLAPQA